MRPVPRHGGQAGGPARAWWRRSAIGRVRLHGTIGCVTADGRFAPSPTGTLHLGNLRTALLAWLFARAAGRPLPDARGGPRRRPRARALHERAARRPRRARPRLGRAGRAPVRAHRRSTRRRSSALRAAGLVYPLLVHARGDPRGGVGPARAAARGRLPGHVPAPDAPRSAPSARRSGRPPALRVRADAARVAFDGPPRRALRGRRRRLRRPPQRRRLRLQPRGGGRRRRAGRRRGRARRRPARLHAAPAVARRAGSGCRPRATPTWRSCSAPTASAWPSATAP